MASGDSVVKIFQVMPPQANFAALVRRAGGSTPAEGLNVWAFDGTAIEYLDFLCRLRGYGGGGLTFTLPFSATSATSGTVVWGIAIRRFALDAEDVDTSQTYDFNLTGGVTVANVSGEIVEATITFTNGADMDSWANNETAIVRIQRVPTDGNDTVGTDVELWDSWDAVET